MKKLWKTIKPIIYSYTTQYILLLIVIISYIALTKDTSIITNPNKTYKFTVIGITISMIPISIYLYKKYKIKEQSINLKRILIMIPLGMSISLFYNMLTINFQTNNSLIDLNILTIVSYVVVLGPIFEELLFRYVSLRIAKKDYQEKTAVIIISIIFALLHSGIINIIYAFLISIILSYIYIKYKNIIYPIILHISANLMSIFIKEFNLFALIISIIILIIITINITKTKHI